MKAKCYYRINRLIIRSLHIGWLYFFFFSINCSIASIKSNNKESYIVLELNYKDKNKEIWINCIDSNGSHLIILNAKNPKDSLLTNEKILAVITSFKCENSFNIKYNLFPKDHIIISINSKEYPVLKKLNKDYHHIEINYYSLLNDNFNGIDNFGNKILNYILCNNGQKEKVRNGEILNPLYSFLNSNKFLDSLYNNKAVSYNFYKQTIQGQYYSFLGGILQSKNKNLIKKYINQSYINDTLTKHEYYIDFLYNYAIYFVEDEFTKKNHEKYYLQCEKMYKGSSRDAVLFYSLASLSISSSATVNSFAKRFIKTCKDTSLVRIVKNNYLSTNYNKSNSNELIKYSGKSYKNLQELINESPDKAIYVDFWASWCRPCLSELPHSKSLKEEYNKKGIKFIYISIDKYRTAWERSMKQVDISKTESYWLPEAGLSNIVKQLHIKSIPRYIIMDKTGKVLNYDAPRPSDPKIREVFSKLLKN
ncbi:TlpA family protein disulfide reductase [Larkinella sp. VNQ87]|uniref:TlpA family protein disulfide reductase n=1 Tax=Larkinella sp. VNQ87 TaxID=3400921 RepID=UPI003C0D98C9